MYTARQTAESRTICITVDVLEKSQGCMRSLSSGVEELPECLLQR